jgi:hypothetical protein
MSDNAACSVNDLPKVTSILKSEAVSKTEAFDMMVRFLSKHQFQYSDNVNNPQPQQTSPTLQDLDHPRFGRLYHFWEDLYHVAETLAVRHGNERPLYVQQQETLRKLRLVAAPINAEIPNDEISSPIKQETLNQEDDYTSTLTKDVVKVETTVKQEGEEDVQQHRKDSKRSKKEKKKEKKRKRESESTNT